MPLTRVYVPLTAADLESLRAGADLGPPLAAHGVTPALGRAGGATDAEQLEHLAWVAATEEAEVMRAGHVRRVIASADVDAGAVEVPAHGDPPSRVEVTTPLPRARVVSFHVDEEPGGTGTADLLWYDVTELDVVLDLLTP